MSGPCVTPWTVSDCCDEMMRSRVLLCLCVGKSTLFFKLKLSKKSWKVIVLGSWVSLTLMLKSPQSMCSPWSVIDNLRYWAKSRVNWRMLVFGGLYRTARLTGDFCFPIWSLKSEHSIEEYLCSWNLLICMSSLWISAIPPPLLLDLGNDVILYPIGQVLLGGMMLLSSLNQISVNARMSSLLLIISVWIPLDLLPANQQFSRPQVTSWCLFSLSGLMHFTALLNTLGVQSIVGWNAFTWLTQLDTIVCMWWNKLWLALDLLYGLSYLLIPVDIMLLLVILFREKIW